MEIAEEEYCVTCPKCGKIHQRSSLAESAIQCSRCGCKFYVCVREDFILEILAGKIEEGKFPAFVRKLLPCFEEKLMAYHS